MKVFLPTEHSDGPGRGCSEAVVFWPVKVLIVDDQAAVRESLQVLFELHGLESLTATNPEEALDLVASEDVGVVVQDMNFTQHDTTGGSGVALFRALRTLDADLPIVVLTAFGSFETAVKLVKEGASDYMEKPWDEEKLVRIVQKSLQVRGLQQENIRSGPRARGCGVPSRPSTISAGSSTRALRCRTS